MITIDISVNGKTVYARTATNTGKFVKGCINPKTGQPDGKYWSIYTVDTGGTIDHHMDDGIIKLVEKLLKTIKE